MQIGWYTLDKNTVFRNRYEVPCWYEDVKCLAGTYAVYAVSDRGSMKLVPIWVVVPGFVVEDYFPSITTRTVADMKSMTLPYDCKQNAGRMSGHLIEIEYEDLAKVAATHEVYASGKWKFLSNFKSKCTRFRKEDHWSIVQLAIGKAQQNKNEEQGYGLYLNQEEADGFCRLYAKAENMHPSSVPLFAPHLRCADLSDRNLYSYGRILHLDGKLHPEDCKRVRDGLFLFGDRRFTYSVSEDADDSFVFLHSGHCYAGIQEMAVACRRLYGAFLPSDFDFEAHTVFSAQICAELPD